MNEPRILVIVDMSNIYYSTKNTLRRKVDYGLYLERAVNGRAPKENVTAIIHGIDLGETQRPFRNYLSHLGFQLKFREPKENRRGDMSADCDLEIVADIFEHTLADDYDILILGSADGDFARTLEIVRNHGKRCEVFACRLSWKLREIADSWQEISSDVFRSDSGPDQGDDSATEEQDIRPQTVES